MSEPMNEQWTDAARDEIYTELCSALTDADDKSELFLSRLCLLLMEELGSPQKARACRRCARSCANLGCFNHAALQLRMSISLSGNEKPLQLKHLDTKSPRASL